VVGSRSTIEEVSVEPTDPTDETRRADEADALARHDADREPTEGEERVADQQGDLDPSVAEQFETMNRLGADVAGEGQIEP
jgi:hypothetical protein